MASRAGRSMRMCCAGVTIGASHPSARRRGCVRVHSDAASPSSRWMTCSNRYPRTTHPHGPTCSAGHLDEKLSLRYTVQTNRRVAESAKVLSESFFHSSYSFRNVDCSVAPCAAVLTSYTALASRLSSYTLHSLYMYSVIPLTGHGPCVRPPVDPGPWLSA